MNKILLLSSLVLLATLTNLSYADRGHSGKRYDNHGRNYYSSWQNRGSHRYARNNNYRYENRRYRNQSNWSVSLNLGGYNRYSNFYDPYPTYTYRPRAVIGYTPYNSITYRNSSNYTPYYNSSRTRLVSNKYRTGKVFIRDRNGRCYLSQSNNRGREVRQEVSPARCHVR